MKVLAECRRKAAVLARFGSSMLGLFGLVALGSLTSCLAFADIISDQLVIQRPGFPTEILTITEADEANAPPGMPASVTTAFLADHGTYCVQTNCQEGQSNISLIEPGGGPISDTVLARLEFFTPAFDRITLKMFSDTETGGGGVDMSEASDVTHDLFTRFPAGFSVTAISDVPEPTSLYLFFSCLACLSLSNAFSISGRRR